MKLPINWNTLPCKEKYLDEETPELAYWFIFGEYSDGTVDVYNGTSDIFNRVPVDKAYEILEARDIFVREIVRICNESKTI